MKIEINKGDIIYAGKFKNKKQEVKSITKDEYGQPVVNGRKALTFKIEKLMSKKENNMEEQKSLRKEIQKITQEILSELNYRGRSIVIDPTSRRIDGLVNRNHVKNIQSSIKGIIEDVYLEEFDAEDILKYIIKKTKEAFEHYIKQKKY